MYNKIEYDAWANKVTKELVLESEIEDAVNLLKYHPEKYPDFSFFKPDFDCIGWAKHAIDVYDDLFPFDADKASVFAKLLIVRTYRIVAKKYRKAGRDNELDSDAFLQEVLAEVKERYST